MTRAILLSLSVYTLAYFRSVNWVNLAWFQFSAFAVFATLACLKLGCGFLDSYGFLGGESALSDFAISFKTRKWRKQIARNKKTPKFTDILMCKLKDIILCGRIILCGSIILRGRIILCGRKILRGKTVDLILIS